MVKPGVLGRLATTLVVGVLAITLLMPAASAQVPTEISVSAVPGTVHTTESCDGTSSTEVSLGFFWVQVNNGGAGDVEIPVTWTFDLSDGSTPSVPATARILPSEGHTTVSPNTGTATGSITATFTAPDGYTIVGPATVTLDIILEVTAPDCATPTTQPGPATPAAPVSGAATFTG